MFGEDASTEDDSERNGVLSYAAEWHALAIGLFNGMKGWRARPKTMPDNSDVQAEPHYYATGYVIGTILQAVIFVGLLFASQVL